MYTKSACYSLLSMSFFALHAFSLSAAEQLQRFFIDMQHEIAFNMVPLEVRQQLESQEKNQEPKKMWLIPNMCKKGFIISPSGKFAIYFSNNTIGIKQGENSRTFGYNHSSIEFLALSPDSTFIAAGFENGTIEILDLDLNTLKTFSFGSSVLKDIIFSPDGKTIALEISPLQDSREKELQVWGLSSDNKSATLLTTIKTIMNTANTKGIAFSPLGTRIISWDEGSTLTERGIKIWNTPSGELEDFLPCDNGICRQLICGSKGTIAALFDEEILLWNSKTGKTLTITPPGNNDKRACISFRRDEKIIASSDGNTILLVDADTGNHLKSFAISSQKITFSSTGTQLYITQLIEGFIVDVDWGNIIGGNLDWLNIISWNVFTPSPIEWLQVNVTIPQASLIAKAYKAKNEQTRLTIEQNKESGDYSDDYKALMSIDNADIRNFSMNTLEIQLVAQPNNS
ncbi:hypothetical protein H0W26_04850 [Candidatus Dependentiae bacterium]|nr:hypothetical protein [Candidatus Dependentiae bacterium]